MAAPRKMEPGEWRWTPHFAPEEFRDPYGVPDSGLCMDPGFMDALALLREEIKAPVLVNPNGGFASRGHEPGSAHYLGLAADIRVPGVPLDTLSHAIRARGFSGVGFYEHWGPIPGFHVDMAPRRARWVRTAAGVYVSLT